MRYPRSLTVLFAIVLAACGDESVAPTVAPAPEVAINSPGADTTITQGEGVVFSGIAVFDGRDLSEEIVWSSDVDAVLGEGASIIRLGLSAGVHTITASVSESGDTVANGSSSVAIVVEESDAEAFPLASVTSGSRHSCGLTPDGRAFCWGQNSTGRLGDGTTIDSSLPVAVTGGHTFTDLSAGEFMTCGVAGDGAAYCWGSGHLGDGPRSSSSTPVRVSGEQTFTEIVVGYFHVCALDSEGMAYCWGLNHRSYLGDGSTTDSDTPVPVSGGRVYSKITTAPEGEHTCGLALDGSAYCWGRNFYGGLGDGSKVDSEIPVPVSGGHTFTDLSAGLFHACGLTTEGSTYCWGDGSSTPSLFASEYSFEEVSAGSRHTCGLTSDGTAYCWGENSRGELGDGTNLDRETPVPVWGEHTFAEIDAGGSSAGAHTCGVVSPGIGYCWGWNRWGQLGKGTESEVSGPVKVASP